MNVYTEAKLASLFNVTTTSPYECDLKMAVPVKGRKSYNNAKAVSIRVAENKAFGYAVSIMLLVDGHYRKIQWRMLSDEEKKNRVSGNLVGISINLCKSIQKELFINDTP